MMYRATFISLALAAALAAPLVTLADPPRTQNTSSYDPNSSTPPPSSVPQANPSQTPTSATPSKGLSDYVPLEPIGGLSQYETGNIKSFPALLAGLFPIALALGALFAVVTFVWGGVVYMFSAVTDRIDWARGKMRSSIYGFLLLMLAWVILNTINPQLLHLSDLFAGQNMTSTTQTSGATGNSSASNASTANSCATTSGFTLMSGITCAQAGQSCISCTDVSGGACCVRNNSGA